MEESPNFSSPVAGHKKVVGVFIKIATGTLGGGSKLMAKPSRIGGESMSAR
jgi:hypothetical protein